MLPRESNHILNHKEMVFDDGVLGKKAKKSANRDEKKARKTESANKDEKKARKTAQKLQKKTSLKLLEKKDGLIKRTSNSTGSTGAKLEGKHRTVEAEPASSSSRNPANFNISNLNGTSLNSLRAAAL